MKNIITETLTMAVRAILLVCMTGIFAFTAHGQATNVEGTLTINGVSPATGPYYPFDEIDVDYTATGFPTGTTYRVILDANSNSFFDEGDYSLASSTTADDELTITIPNDQDLINGFSVNDLIVVAGNDGTAGDDEDEVLINPGYGDLSTLGEISGAFNITFDQAVATDEARNLEFTYDLSSSTDAANLNSVLEIGLDVSAVDVNPVTLGYSTDGGTTYTALADIYGDDEFEGTSTGIIVELPEAIATEEVTFRLSQPGSDTFATASDKAWTVSDFDIRRSTGTFVQYDVLSETSVDLSSPVLNLNYGSDVLADFVGEDFSVKFEAKGFGDDAVFYLYSGTILDSADRVIYDEIAATELDANDSATFKGTWLLEDVGDIDLDLRVAAIYGDIDAPKLEFEAESITISGSDESGFTYTFDQDGVRSIRTNSVDLSSQDYLTLYVEFGSSAGMDDDEELLVQYSANGGDWVTIDELEGGINFSTLSYLLDEDAISTDTEFRVRQKDFNLGSTQTWSVDGIWVEQYLEFVDQAYLTATIDNYSVTLDSVYDADNNIIVDLGADNTDQAYPGDEITVYGSVEGFDPDGESYTVIIDGQYLLDVSSMTVADDSTITVVGTIPTDIEYDNGYSLELKKYDGTSAQLGVSEDLFDDYRQDEFEFMGGDYNTTNISFNASGDRWVESPEFEIASADDLTLSFDLSRINSVRSPSGTEIVVEYTTDGSSYTELDEISINEAGTGGTNYELSELPEGVASTSTQFRFRQASNNGEDLDAWKLSNVMVEGATNIVFLSYLDYTNNVTLDVLEPTLELSAVADTDDLYPGTEFSADFEITNGAFPSGTKFTLYLDREEFDINLGNLEANGTFTANTPALVAGNYDLFVMADFGEITSNTTILPIVNVEINNISISSDDALTDGTDEIVYPGSTLDFSYNVVGDIGSDVTATLEVYDNTKENGDDVGYVTLASQEAVDGTISVDLPVGLDYNGDPAFQLSLINGNLETVEEIENLSWGTNNTTLTTHFPDQVNHQFNNYFYQDGERSATSVELDFSEGTPKVNFDIEVLNGNFDEPQWLYLEYSVDDKETWVAFDSAYMVEGNEELFPDYIQLPEEAWMESTYLRFISNEDEQVTGSENVIYFSGWGYQLLKEEPIATTTFNLSQDLELENLSLSISDLGEPDPEYLLGESFTVEYNADGPFPDDVSFAVVLEGNDNATSTKYVLGESSTKGAATIEVNFPSTLDELNELENPSDDNEYNLTVVPFIKGSDDETYLPATLATDVAEEDDFLVVEGSDETTPEFTFDQTGDRSLLTKAYDLTTTDTVTLEFDFTYTSGTPSTLLVLPQLQVSTDGGETFEVLSVDEEDSDYAEEGYLFNTVTDIQVGIPDEYLTEATHFRWVQALNRGESQNVWRVDNIQIIEGETNAYPTANYEYGPNEDQNVNAVVPDLDDYDWEQNDLTDAVFNGEDFEYVFTIDSTELEEPTFPEGTEFVFTLQDVTDPDTNEDLVIATTSEYGVGTASIPFYVENDGYSVYAQAIYTTEVDGEEVESVLDEQVIASLDVFLKAIRTTYTGDEMDVLYAGSTATFSITSENDETNTSAYDDLYANLLIKDYSDGEDLVLATQQGIADITIDLPPYVRGGDFEFVTEITEDGPMGEVGDLVSESSFDDLVVYEDGNVRKIVTRTFTEAELNGNDRVYVGLEGSGDSDVEISYSLNGAALVSEGTVAVDGGALDFLLPFDMRDGLTTEDDEISITIELEDLDGSTIELTSNTRFRLGTSDVNIDDSDYSSEYYSLMENDFGRGIIKTRDFMVGELENASLISFDLTFDETFDNISESQRLVFEYSIDGGATFTQIDTIPSLDYYDDPETQSNIDDTFISSVTDEMKDNMVRFRFRQEERNNINVVVEEFTFLPAESLPFDYISDTESITNQSLLITSIGAEEACPDDEVTLNYEVRGRFGAKNVVTVWNSGTGTLSGYEFEITEGTGEVTFDLPSDVVSTGGENQDLTFRLDYDDDTNKDFNYDDDGVESDQSMEVVARITTSSPLAGLTDGSLDQKSCDLGDDVEFDLTNLQTNFRYIIRNAETGDGLDTLMYDGESATVNIGAVTEALMLDVVVTSMSSAGDECNTVEFTDSPFEIEILEDYELSYNNTEHDPVMAGDSVVICEGGSVDEVLSLVRPDDVTGSPTIEWFRNDFNTPITNSVGSASQLSGSEFDDEETATYFARITDGACTYVTESFKVVVEEQPELPEITVVSGDLSFCEGEGEVELSAPAGFTFYEWSPNGETTQTITVEDAGSYTVQVGNISTCLSEDSEPVEIESSDQLEFTVESEELDNLIYGGEVIRACDEADILFKDEDGSSQTSESGIYVIYKDGVKDQVVTGDNADLTESGEYYVEWMKDELGNGACTTVSPTFTVEITESIDERPVITAGGSLAFCEGGSVTLTAPAGFEHYKWYGGSAGTTVLNNTSETLEVTEDGMYKVEVSNVSFTSNFTCASPASKMVEVNVFEELDLDLYVNTGPYLDNMEVVNVCSEDDPQLSLDGASGDYTVTWYQDGTAIAGTSPASTTIDLTASGTYHAEVTQSVGGALDDSEVCVSATYPVVVNYYEELDPVSIAEPAETEFCEGEVNLTLTADEGAAYYTWYKGTAANVIFEGSSNEIQVNAQGDYWVTVAAAEDACESDVSNVISIETEEKADPELSVTTVGADCSTGDVRVRLGETGGKSTDPETTYQLLNAETGEALGNPVIGSGDVAYVTISGLEERVGVLVEATPADGSGCSDVSVGSKGLAIPNTIVLEVEGTRITAHVDSYVTDSDDDVVYDISWFRNGTLMRNASGNVINVTDAAEYSVEVTFADGCVITSNSVDIGAGTSRVASSASNGRIVANTYPNPSSSVVNVDVPGENFGTYKVQIMTMSGQVMISGEFTKSEANHIEQIDIADLDMGIYNMTVVKGKQIENIRIVKQ